jgi:acyl carrier protein
MNVQTGDVTGLAELRQTIAEILDVPAESITDNARFIDDLGVDSLMALEIMVVLEKKYAIKIAEAELPRITCLRAVYDVVNEKRTAA